MNIHKEKLDEKYEVQMQQDVKNGMTQIETRKARLIEESLHKPVKLPWEFLCVPLAIQELTRPASNSDPPATAPSSQVLRLKMCAISAQFFYILFETSSNLQFRLNINYHLKVHTYTGEAGEMGQWRKPSLASCPLTCIHAIHVHKIHVKLQMRNKICSEQAYMQRAPCSVWVGSTSMHFPSLHTDVCAQQSPILLRHVLCSSGCRGTCWVDHSGLGFLSACLECWD